MVTIYKRTYEFFTRCFGLTICGLTILRFEQVKFDPEIVNKKIVNLLNEFLYNHRGVMPAKTKGIADGYVNHTLLRLVKG